MKMISRIRILAFITVMALLFSVCAAPVCLAEEDTAAEEYYDEYSEVDDEEYVGEPIVVDDLMINDELDDGWWNILLLGTDARYASGHGRTDNIVILSVNSETHQAKLTSIMRDTWVDIYGIGYNKINTPYRFGGIDLALRTINEYFAMNIDDYVVVDMLSLVNIIDTIGGIDIDITEDEKYYINSLMQNNEIPLNDPSLLKEYGENVHLTGNQALCYSRIRHLDSDAQRTQRQRNTLIGIAKKLQSCDLTTLWDAINTMVNFVETDLDLTQIMTLANIGLSVDLSMVEQLRLPAEGTYKSGMYEGTYSIRPDFEANQKILHDFIYGEAAE